MVQARDIDGGTGVLGAKHLAYDDIPVIDIAGLFSDDRRDRLKVAEAVGDACRNVGFFYIRNHRVPPPLIDGADEAVRAFFDLPIEEKMKLDIAKVQRHRGFVAMGALYADPTAEPDLQEGYEISLELGEDDPDYLAGNIMYGPNLWPDCLPSFRPAVYGYFERVLDLGHLLFRAFALALQLEEDFFEDKIDKPMAQLRLIYYPPRQGVIDPKRIGIGPHTDYECFTILWQSDAEGLQVADRAGAWVEAPPIPGTFVVNIGDMMMRWTNGLFASTPHRVINTARRARYSMPFFFGANYDTVVRSLPGCTGPENPPRYPPTNCGLWTVGMITEAYEYRKDYRGKVPSPELSS